MRSGKLNFKYVKDYTSLYSSTSSVSGSKKAKKLDEGDSLGSSASPKQLWGERGGGASVGAKASQSTVVVQCACNTPLNGFVVLSLLE